MTDNMRIAWLIVRKTLQSLSAGAYYFLSFIVSRFAFGIFLACTALLAWHDFQFNWLFLVMGLAGIGLALHDVLIDGKFKSWIVSFKSLAHIQINSGTLSLYLRNELLIGALIVLSAILSYCLYGFSGEFFAAWVIGTTACGRAFFRQRKTGVLTIDRVDLFCALALWIVSLFLYLWSVYTVPFHVNSDESAILNYEQTFVAQGIHDVFGLSYYYAFPYMPFLVQGWLAQGLGGIDLYHVRWVHAFTGTLIVVCSYAFFRTLSLRWHLALAATIFVAFNHSLIAINRVISQTNTGLFMELLALTTAFNGIKRKSPFWMYLGGILTGLCYYVYYSARMSLPICLMFFLLLFCLKPKFCPRRETVRLTVVFLFGFILAVAPLGAAMVRQPDKALEARLYIQRVCLLYPLGQQLAKDRWGKDGVRHCIVNGLTVFNNDEMDQIFIYANRDHGFVDPVSGVLVWLGLIRALMFLRRRLSILFVSTGFFFEYLIYSFLSFPSPDYTRLLVLLPFAGYFVALGIDLLASFVGLLSLRFRLGKALNVKYVTFYCVTVSIVAINLFIFGEYAAQSAVHGDDIGGLARYVEARKNDPDHVFIVVSSLHYPFFAWSDIDWCYRHLEPYISKKQENEVFAPDDVTAIKIVPPFTMFMSGTVWGLKQEQLKKMYPGLIVHKIADDQELVAIENTGRQIDTPNVHDLYKKWRGYPAQMDKASSNNKLQDVEKLGCQFLSAPTSMIGGSYLKSSVLMRLGGAYVGLKKFDQAESAYLQALKIRLLVEGDGSLDTSDAVDALSGLYAAKGDWHRSEQFYKRAIAMRQAYEKDEGIDWVWGLADEFHGLATALRKERKFEDAEKMYTYAAHLCSTDHNETAQKEEILKELAECRKEHHESVHTAR
jgi:tetratricopeptide (TPR) repeat protein